MVRAGRGRTAAKDRGMEKVICEVCGTLLRSCILCQKANGRVCHACCGKCEYHTVSKCTYLLQLGKDKAEDAKNQLRQLVEDIEARKKEDNVRKMTRELAISRELKEKVARRDSFDGWPCCILCGKPAPSDKPWSYSCAHYISRAQGGMGVERNIVTLCPECHDRYDKTTKRGELREQLRKYLMRCYPDWNEESIVYRKGAE